MSAATLLELAERCVNATGPDRVLADEVLLACGWEHISGNAATMGEDVWYAPDGKCYGVNRPDPTASLDAALTLGDKRMLWCVGKMEEGPFARVLWPQPNGGYVGGLFETNEETEVGALLSALLRARAAMVKP